MSEVFLNDPDELVGSEEKYLELLLKMPSKRFDEHVRRYVAGPTESGQLVFRHPEIVELTNDSLIRLIAEQQRKKQHLIVQTKGRRLSSAEKEKLADIRQVHEDQIEKYQRERKVIKPYLHLAIAEAARNSDRNIASRIVGKVLYDEYTQHVLRDVRNGMSEKEAEAAMRARLAEA